MGINKNNSLWDQDSEDISDRLSFNDQFEYDPEALDEARD